MDLRVLERKPLLLLEILKDFATLHHEHNFAHVGDVVQGVAGSGEHQLVAEAGLDRQTGANLPGVSDEVAWLVARS